MQEWRDIYGYEGLYQISNDGQVKTLHREGIYNGRWKPCKMVFPEKIMRPATSINGYKFVSLKSVNGPKRNEYIHRLVARAFIGDPGNLQVNHIDGVKENNNLSNLEYCTSLENIRHCIDVLGKKRGTGAGNSKLDEEKVRAIRADHRPLKPISAEYGVSVQLVSMVRNRRVWTWLA